MNFMALAPLAGSAVSSIFGSISAKKDAKKAAQAAQLASQQQIAGIDQGLADSTPYYDTAQGYLSPYVDMGTDQAALLQDITGVNGPEAQQRALAMYQSSPSASLLKNARDEAVRSSIGAHSARGLSRSGALTQDIAERTSAMDLANYGNWENLSKGLLTTGANAASGASNLAAGRGSEFLNARTQQGTARASGTTGAANAKLAGSQAAQGYLQNFMGKMSANDWGGGSSWAAPSGSLPWQSNYSQLSGFMSGN